MQCGGIQTGAVYILNIYITHIRLRNLEKKHSGEMKVIEDMNNKKQPVWSGTQYIHIYILTYSIEHSPSWRANQFAASRNSQHFMERKGSVPHSQVLPSVFNDVKNPVYVVYLFPESYQPSWEACYINMFLEMT
jgi:hypothetical protein